MYYIPERLKALPNWVCWGKTGSPLKMPFDPRTGRGADSTDPKTWATFEEAAAEVDNGMYKGVGFELGTAAAPSGVCCIDLDHCLAALFGDLDPTAQTAADVLPFFRDTYIEISQSGEGLHIFSAAVAPGPRQRKKGIEMYFTGRYIAMTGNTYDVIPYDIKNKQSEIDAVYEKYLAEDDQPPAVPAEMPAVDPAASGIARPDSEILRMAARDTKFQDLFHIGHKDGDDKSSNDAALVMKLLWYTQGDLQQTDRLFRQSACYRPKWDERRGDTTYGRMTLANAFKYYLRTEHETLTKELTAAAPIADPGPQAPKQTPADPNWYFNAYAVAGSDPRARFESQVAADVPPVKTGFDCMDEILDGGLYPGLITIGGTTGTGKTTYIMQLLDQIAARGSDVIIFPLEMSREELMARSISRVTFEQDPTAAVPMNAVLSPRRRKSYTPAQEENLAKAKENYFSGIGKHLYVIQGGGDFGTDRIREHLDLFETHMGTCPAIIAVDYVQLLAAPDPRMSDKQAMDKNIMELKRISRDYRIPVIAISSLSRVAYAKEKGKDEKKRVSLEHFKESGAIEYSSDLLLGMNHVGTDYSTSPAAAEIDIDILKNRRGPAGPTLRFKYQRRFNCFMNGSITNAADFKL